MLKYNFKYKEERDILILYSEGTKHSYPMLLNFFKLGEVKINFINLFFVWKTKKEFFCGF